MTRLSYLLATILVGGVLMGGAQTVSAHICWQGASCDSNDCLNDGHTHVHVSGGTCVGYPTIDGASDTGVDRNPVGECASLYAVELGYGAPGTTFYVDLRELAGDSVYSIWIYQETNGYFTGGNVERDLQRGGTSSLVEGDDEICHDGYVPDTLLF